MPEGFLAVSTQPSPQLPLEEFHEWYDEEHIPIRLNNIKEFSSAARYKEFSGDAGSTQKHSWLALYTVESPAIFSSTAYRDLRIKRSERETNVMSRIELLTRRTGEVIGAYLSGEEKTTGFKPGRPSGWVVTHGINTRDVEGRVRDVNSWASHIGQEAAKHGDIEEGWARTLVVLVRESGVTHFGVSVEADEEVKMPYFAVHEFKDKESAESFSKLILESADVGMDLGKRTMWELYKAYPCFGQANGD